VVGKKVVLNAFLSDHKTETNGTAFTLSITASP
jgi:hypothetical protein